MDRWQAMRVFVRVAETAGFAGAARQLNMSPPAVTRAVAALEARIGTRLLTRTTRTVKLTEAGGRYLEDCRRILAEIEEAEAAASGAGATPSGALTVTAPVQFGRLYVLPVITEHLARHPAVTTQALFLDRVINMVEEGVDVGIRIGQLPASGLTAIRVGSVRRVLCAAPAYLDRHGTPVGARDLRDHAVIGLTGTGSAGSGSAAGTPRPRLTCNTVDSVLAAALAGQGIARLLSYQIAPSVSGGHLRIVLDDPNEAPMPIHVVSAEGRRAPAKVRTFIDLAVARLRANPMLNPDRP